MGRIYRSFWGPQWVFMGTVAASRGMKSGIAGGPKEILSGRKKEELRRSGGSDPLFEVNPKSTLNFGAAATRGVGFSDLDRDYLGSATLRGSDSAETAFPWPSHPLTYPQMPTP